MIDEDNQLYILGTYVFSCMKKGATKTKKGRGSIQADLVSTLQVEEEIVLLNRMMPDEKIITMQTLLSPLDPNIQTFIYVCTVRNPATKGRNIRYRLATRSGWICTFHLSWDNTIVDRNTMKSVISDSGKFGGLGDGINVGCGRFEVESYVELEYAKEKTTERDLGNNERNGMDKGRKEMCKV